MGTAVTTSPCVPIIFCVPRAGTDVAIDGCQSDEGEPSDEVGEIMGQKLFLQVIRLR